jgi:MYXO-CTERM domain-containing protein
LSGRRNACIPVPARAAVCAAAIFASTQVFAAAAAVRPVVMTGDAAPGTNGGAFALFDVPTINDAGVVMLRGNLQLGIGGATSDNNLGFWTGTNASDLVLVAREGSPVSGQPDLTFTSVNTAVGAPGGHVMLHGGSSAGGGLYGGATGSIVPIALLGTQPPGYPAGSTYGNDNAGASFNTPPLVNGLGQTVFTAHTASTPPMGDGMWGGTAGNIALITRAGAQAPALPAGVNIARFSDPVLNDLGQIGFDAWLTGNVVTSNNSAVYLGQPGALQVIARGGDPVTGLAGVTYAGNPFGESFGLQSINNAGQAAFSANITGAGVTPANDNVLVVTGPGGSGGVVAVREGDVAPGTAPGVNYTAAGDTHLGGGGHVIFRGGVTGAGVTSANNDAVFTGLPGAIRLLAREGDVAPGLSDGARFSFFEPPTINAAGQVAMLSFLQGPGLNFETNIALVAADTDGELFTIARAGAPLDLGGGDIRTPNYLLYWGFSGGQDGYGSGLNDAGQVAFYAQFTDGSDGVFVAQIPEPSAVAFTALAALAAATARRRRRA